MDLTKLRVDAPAPGPRPGSQASKAHAAEKDGAAPAAPVTTPVQQPAAQAAAAPAAAAGALGLVARHKANRAEADRRKSKGKSRYGAAAAPGEENHNWRYTQEQLQALGERAAAPGAELLDEDFRKQWNYYGASDLIEHLAGAGVPGFAYVKLGTDDKGRDILRPIHGSGDNAKAIELAFTRDPRLTPLALDTPEARMQRIAADSGIAYADAGDLQQKVFAAVGLGGGLARARHQNTTEEMARLIHVIGPRALAAGGEDAAFYRSVWDPSGATSPTPAGETQLPNASTGKSTKQMKLESGNAVSGDTAGAAQQEEAKNWRARAGAWLDAKGPAGVPNWAYTGAAAAGGTVGAGLLLAAALADQGLPQQDTAAYAQQQALNNSYGSY